MFRKITALFLSCLLLSACASQRAVFLSEPIGAQVFIDGQPIGHTPCAYDYSLGSGGSLQVTLEKEGYDVVHHVIQADETDVTARNRWLAAGVVWSPLWLGTLFTKKLKDGYEYVLRQAQPHLTAQAKGAEQRYN
jgi:hypothetical protein